mgnify:CR=1 FL=1
MTTVKIINDIGYIKKDSIGRGFGAWSRAAKIRDTLKLSGMPVSLPEEDWRRLTADRIEDV